MTATRTELRDATFLLYDPSFFGPAEADSLFAELRRDVPWAQEGRPGRRFPRLTAWYADPGLVYSYSGVTHVGLPWTPTLADVRVKVEVAAGREFNSLLLNLYRDGNDSIGFHADDEPELGPDPTVASVSFGGVRDFVLKHKTAAERHKYPLAHGSLLVMGGACQRHWLHGVPKTRFPVAPRINLTFRQILPPPTEASA